MKSGSARAIFTARPTPPNWLKRLARPVVIPLIALSIVTIYAASLGRVVLNSSDSLAARGFFVVVWPKPLIKGAVVVADPPAHLAHRFEGMVFTKRLIGKPGDQISHLSGEICIETSCFARTIKEGAPFGTLLPEGIIPEGHVALFGETPTSLDSRYAEVGLFPIHSIRGVGFGIPHFPDWSTLAEWVKS